MCLYYYCHLYWSCHRDTTKATKKGQSSLTSPTTTTTRHNLDWQDVQARFNAEADRIWTQKLSEMQAQVTVSGQGRILNQHPPAKPGYSLVGLDLLKVRACACGQATSGSTL